MGGTGSGTWWRADKKTAVEDCLTLDVNQLAKNDMLEVGVSGTISWSSEVTSRKLGSVAVAASGTEDGRVLCLQYCRLDRDNVSILVRLQTTKPHFGGVRWWFECPIIVDGVACDRRVGKLHLPRGARYFGCRECHDLTYRSCQESHRTERLFRLLGLECDSEVAKLFR